MDIQKAIEWQKAFKKTYKGVPKEVDEACNMAISALKKQIPKKPTQILKRVNGIYAKCSSCGRSIIKVGYCSKCGQAIDWSDVD